MNVIIDPVLEDRYLNPFGINREQINDTVIHEDVKKLMHFGEFTLILFLKKFNGYYVLIDGRWHPSSFSLLISSAFKIDQQLIGNISIENPLAILEKLANEFGADITMGDQTARFIHDARIEIRLKPQKDEDFMTLVNRHISFSENGVPITIIGGNYVGDMLARPQQSGEKLFADIALLYRINVDRYRRHLQSNNLI
jgi:hypothetical protein